MIETRTHNRQLLRSYYECRPIIWIIVTDDYGSISVRHFQDEIHKHARYQKNHLILLVDVKDKELLEQLPYSDRYPVCHGSVIGSFVGSTSATSDIAEISMIAESLLEQMSP